MGEPTASLDPASAERIRTYRIALHIARKRGLLLQMGE